MARVKEYIVVARDKETQNINTDYIQAVTAQQAVDILYSYERDRFEILDVAVIVKNWK